MLCEPPHITPEICKTGIWSDLEYVTQKFFKGTKETKFIHSIGYFYFLFLLSEKIDH